MTQDLNDVTPSASRLTNSLRDIGYDFQSALADVVDNSVSAGATQVDVDMVFNGPSSHVSIIDDGDGMTESVLHEAMRFGSRREYEFGALGRYGLGLKTASISQCRALTVLTRRAPTRRRIAASTLDLDHIERTDRWELVSPPARSVANHLKIELAGGPGTVVIWEGLDRVLGPHPSSGWARRRMNSLEAKARSYLGMVFHRFIEGSTAESRRLTITVNGEKVEPWNPFAPLEEARIELQPLIFEVPSPSGFSAVHLRRYVLPPRGSFSTQNEFERLSGPGKWNKQQGLYVYRADRLIQHGGWSGIRAVDEHTKLARASLDFQTDLDEAFQINVAKMRVGIPPEVRTLLERPVHELCHRADAVYRGDAQSRSAKPKPEREHTGSHDARELGAAIMTAALSSGDHEAMLRVMANLREAHPGIARSLGW